MLPVRKRIQSDGREYNSFFKRFTNLLTCRIERKDLEFIKKYIIFANMILKSPKIFKIVLIIFCLALPTSLVASGGEPDDKNQKSTTKVDENTLCYYSQIFGYTIKTIMNVKLYDVIDTWLGTPYRYAGNSMKGVDCSAFARVLYEKAFNVVLEGGSADIVKNVTPVSKNELIEGDLVFFKTRKSRVSHVGVYLGENKFAHASSSSGVMISDLDDPYWKQRYYNGGRIPEKDTRFQSSR